ncbi:MAG: radical SAM protein [Planctomycetota bacterium]
MGLLTRVKEYTVYQTVDALVGLAARGARRNVDVTLRKMLEYCLKLTGDRVWTAVVKDLLRKLNEGHPAMELARRFLTELNPTVRSKLVRCLFVEGTLLGPKRRHALESELGYYPPSTLVISPSMRCPLRCYGCYAGSYSKEDELTFDDVDTIVRDAKALGMYFLVISGGEPFAWEPLMRILEEHNDVYFLVYTSGLLLDDATVDRLAELGNCCPAISCEGFEEETDKRRGKGAFKKVERAMRRLAKRGVVVSFSATATRHNIDTITSDRFVDYLIDAGCMMGWYFSYMPIGRSPELDLMPTPEQRVQLSRRVKELRAQKAITLIDFWNDGEFSGGCIAGGRKYLHINNKGDVEPCVFCHFATDNIKETPLKEALASDFFKAIRARQPYHDDLRRVCIMIDNPSVLRDVVAETGARGTHEGAETLIQGFAGPLDEYARQFGEALKHGPVCNIVNRV